MSKIQRDHHQKIEYSQHHWNLLNYKRVRAQELLHMFKRENLNPFVYGSIARGDINEQSDIDIIFLYKLPSYKIEFILQNNGFKNYKREIIMATPNDDIKLYIYLNELESITLPLTKLNKSNREFYDFSGRVDYDQIKENVRVPGIDKRLLFIKPTDYGHEEHSVINNEGIYAKELGVSTDIIKQRVNVLLRREKFGRTGVFLKRELSFEDTPQGTLKELSNQNSIVRKKLQ